MISSGTPVLKPKQRKRKQLHIQCMRGRISGKVHFGKIRWLNCTNKNGVVFD